MFRFYLPWIPKRKGLFRKPFAPNNSAYVQRKIDPNPANFLHFPTRYANRNNFRNSVINKKPGSKRSVWDSYPLVIKITDDTPGTHWHTVHISLFRNECANKTGPNLKGNFNYLTFDIWFHFSACNSSLRLRLHYDSTRQNANTKCICLFLCMYSKYESASLFHWRFITGINTVGFLFSEKITIKPVTFSFFLYNSILRLGCFVSESIN